MEYKKIEDLTTVITGGTPSTAKAEYWEGGDIPWLQSGCCQNCDVTVTEKHITRAGYENSSTKMMPPETVMIALTGATAGKVGFLKFEACGNQSITGILPCNSLNQRFLFYYLLSQRDKILADCIGGAQRSVYPSPQSSWRCPRTRSILHMGFLLSLHAKDNGQILSRFHHEKGVLLWFGDYPPLLRLCESSQHRPPYIGQHDDMEQSDIPRNYCLYRRLSALELGNAKAWSCEIH